MPVLTTLNENFLSCPELPQTTKTEYFAIIIKPLIIVAKIFILDVCRNSGYTSYGTGKKTPKLLNPYVPNAPFLYPLRFSDVFTG